MKTIHDTPDMLILENKPIWLALGISVFGLVFFGVGMASINANFGLALMFMAGGLGIGIGFNMIFVRRTQLTLDGPGNLATLRRRGWLGDSQMHWELPFLQEAVVETSRSSNNSNTYRAALVVDGGMDPGTHPLTIVYASGAGAQNAANAINRWLDTHRATA